VPLGEVGNERRRKSQTRGDAPVDHTQSVMALPDRQSSWTAPLLKKTDTVRYLQQSLDKARQEMSMAEVPASGDSQAWQRFGD